MARWGSSDIPDQTGRTALVTGANSGLGLSSAEALARKGAAVLMACRNPTRAETARARVAAVATGPAPVAVSLDLADLASVRAVVAEVAEHTEVLDVLLNNAGIMAPPLGRTTDGYEMQFGTNHLGHFALTGLLLPSLLRADHPRVVTTSSTMHRIGDHAWDDPGHDTRTYRRWPAYGRSKLANLLFTRELARRAEDAGSGLVSAAAHPGYASTHLQTTGARSSGDLLGRASAAVMAIGNGLVAQSAEAGALPQLYAATMPDVAPGDYFGPDGPFEMRGSPKRVGATAAARDDAAAQRLWSLSEDLTGVTYGW
ncbi:MAG: oxidoreductase [Acidimicrobiales bacterium]|nr:oxidoreductase [Acidimicrobiales bacterium]